MRDEYKRTRDVALQELWTVSDLSDMSVRGGDLYNMARGEPYRLKDGIIRKFKEDLRQFKPIYRLLQQSEPELEPEPPQ